MPKTNFPQKARAFTLIELLTVIAIIGILASILIPTVAKVRDTARQSVCGSNLRQTSMALVLYSMDNDGNLPHHDFIHWQPGRDVMESPIVPYVGGNFTADIFRCPSHRDYESGNDPTFNYSRIYPYSFTMNILFVERNIDTIDNPSRIIMMFEEELLNDALYYPWFPLDRVTTRHGGRGNVGFADGHVQLVTPEFGNEEENWDPDW